MLRDNIYLRYLRTPPHFLKNRLLRLLRSVLFLERVRFISLSGIRMELDPSDFVQIMILHGGAYEPNTLELVRRLLPVGGTFIDIGGHVGQYALEAAHKVGAAGRVIVVEPNPRTFSYLHRNIQLNRFTNIIPVIGTVADKQGFVNMEFPPEDNWGASCEATSSDRAAYRAASFSLETLLNDLGVTEIDIVKIDVEGHEIKVLEGLLAGRRFQPENIIIEHLPKHFSQSLQVPAFLKKMGYALFDIAGRPVDLEAYPYTALQEDNLWVRRSDLPPVH
jgi:FkbM family methyltransferase